MNKPLPNGPSSPWLHSRYYDSCHRVLC